MFATLRSWLVGTVFRSRFERDLDDEIALHLSLRADELERNGLSRAEAERRARVDFGGRQAHKADARTSRGLSFVDSLVSDVRYVTRSLSHHLVLSTSIVASLALTIGISTGVFTLIDAVALRAHIDRERASFFRVRAAYTTDADRFPRFGLTSFTDYLAYRDAATSARAMTAYVRLSAPFDAADPVNTRILAVTCDFFTVYVPPRPLAGRTLVADDCAHAEDVVVLSEAVWRERYAADSAIVGKTVRLNDRPVTVVGVLPTYAGQVESAVAWIPLTITPALGLGLDFANHPEQVTLSIDGLTARGHSRANVAAEIAAAAARQDRLTPGRTSRILVTDGSPVADPGSRATITTVVSIVMLVVGFVVVIACTNVTTLLLSRAEARRQEVAIRLAIGASRNRLLRLLLTETVLLTTIAGAISVWFAYRTPRLIMRILTGRTFEWSLDPDWRVFTWLTVITVVAGIAAGLTPALQALDLQLVDAIKAGQSFAGAAGRRVRTYRRLIASQLALSFVLLVGAYLFERAHLRMATTNVGHATRDLISVTLLDRNRAKGRVVSSFLPRVRPRLLAIPGVEHVAFGDALPSALQLPTFGVTLQGIREGATPLEISGGFFETLGMSIVRGRALDDADPPCQSGGCPVVISQELARRVFGTGNAVGAALRSDSGVVMQVVGVAADVTDATGRNGPVPVIYQPWDPVHGRYLAFARFRGNPAETMSAIGSTVREAVTEVSVGVQVVQAQIDQDVLVFRQLAILIGVLAAIAVGLAAIGVYGVVSFSVKRRTKELGVRIALGATTRDVYREVARGYARPIAVGLTAGLAISVPAAMFVQSAGGGASMPLLDRSSPIAFAVAMASILVVTILAIAGPARRAAAADPVRALRME
jgi:predicted permease